MNQYIFFLILLNLCLCREYQHLPKSEPHSFDLDETKFEYGAYLDYEDIYEEKDEVAENSMYFLKINDGLKVNCIISNKDKEPDEEVFNRDTSNEYCKLNISLVNDKKLVDFPKKLEKGQRIYFLFFTEKEETPDFFLTSTFYEVRKVPFPKPIEVKDYDFELGEGDANIYLMKQPKDENYDILSTLSDFKISVYAYSKKNFVNVGYIGENNLIFQFDKSLELDNNYLYIVIDNPNEEKKETIKFSYNKKVHLFTYDANDYIQYKFDTLYSLLQIYNPEHKLIKFNYTVGVEVKYLDEEHENMDNILNEKYYGYIPSKYYYPSKDYSVFLIKSEQDGYLAIELPDLTEKPTEIEMDNFVYFKIIKEEELELSVKYPENPIILKLICTNTGNVEIKGKSYTLSNQNQIEVIDNENSETFKIKALDNTFILAVRSKIPDDNIEFGDAGIPLGVSNQNYSKFIVFDIDYIHYDYIQFSSSYNRVNSTTIPEFTTDFGLLSNNEITKNDYYTKYDFTIYDLQYYKNKLQLKGEAIDLKKVYHYINISEHSDVKIYSTYYKEFNYNLNEYMKTEKDNYMFRIKQKMRVFFITDSMCIFEINCPGEMHGIWSWNEIGYTIPENEIGCYLSFENSGYVHFELLNDDDPIYEFDDIEYKENTQLKAINSSFLELFFNYNVSNTTELNFTFIITDSKNEESFENRLGTFENFYLNNNYNESEYEIYNFTFKDLKTKSENCTILLPSPTKFNITDKSKNFTYVLLVQVTSTKMVHIYLPKSFTYEESKEDEDPDHGSDDKSDTPSDDKSDTPSDDKTDTPTDKPNPPTDNNTDKDKNDDNNKNLIIIIVVIVVVVIIILVAILLIIKCKKKKNSNIEANLKDNSLGEGMTGMTEI